MIGTPGNARSALKSAFRNYASPLGGILGVAPNNTEGYGLVNALSTALSMLPIVSAQTSHFVSATSPIAAALIYLLLVLAVVFFVIHFFSGRRAA